MTTRAAVRENYLRSPIEEVACEFEFTERAWDATLQGRFYENMRAHYPAEPKPLNFETAVVGRPAHVVKMLLSTTDEKSQVRFGASSLSVHTLAPYPGWEVFSDRVHQALRVFLKTAQPKAVAQINLRYQNKFLIPAQSLVLADYFTLGTPIPHGLPTRLISYVTGLRSAYDEPHKVLSLSLTANPPERDAKHAVEATLEIMTSMVRLNDPAEQSALVGAIEDLHAKAADAFEKVITNHTRALFR